ncbi:MAG: glycosyltransferase [Alloprevotella sp.]
MPHPSSSSSRPPFFPFVLKGTPASTPEGYAVSYRLEPGAGVFAAHFPQRPIVPGVFLLRLAVEAFNAGRQSVEPGAGAMEIVEVNNAKFLAVVEPEAVKEIVVEITHKSAAGPEQKVKANIVGGEVRFAAFSLTLSPVSGHAETTESRHEPLPADVCGLIPTYNNAATLSEVIRGVRAQLGHVIVVNDGSTDATAQVLAQVCGADQAEQRRRGFTVLTHPHNRGKGAALATGLGYARAEGYRYAVTVDADGQHRPSDIPLLLAPLGAHPDALVLGSRRSLSHANKSAGSTFANRFSNFWFAVQTFRRLPDTQCGLRVYPLRRLPRRLRLTSGYEAELTLLVFPVWRGTATIPVDVNVCYPPAAERVSHFRPIRDFARISLLNTWLCFLAVVWGWPRMVWRALRRLSAL